MNTRYLAVALATLSAPIGAQAANPANAFNPKISLILQGQYADFESTADAELPGFVLGPETELKPAGSAIGEAELTIESNIDDAWHGWATVALENEDGETVVAVEEMYVNSLALPQGLQLKFGRFFSDIGYHNRQHAHAWDFIDAPLVYRAFLANTYSDDGVQLRWVAPADVLIELGVEGMRGAGFPGGGEGLDGINATTAFAHLGGDVGIGGAWRLGLSLLSAEPLERESGEEGEPGVLFSGNSDTTIVDFIYKWAPNGNATERSFKFQAEYFSRSEDGTLQADGVQSAYDGDQSGFYLQAVYGFMRGWRIGARYDFLESDNQLANPGAEALERVANAANDEPTRTSVMIDYSRSEFSRFRLQYNIDASRPGSESDKQLFLQYIFSLGSHPAHVF